MKKLPLLASTLIAAAALVAPAFADDVTWNGTSGGTWDTSTENWTGDSTTFTTNDNVTFGSTGVGTITLGEDITAGNITFTEGGYTISNSTGTSLTGSTLTVEGTDGTTVTIAVTTIKATAINFANHNATGGAGDSTTDDYKHLVIGDGENTTTATAGSMSILGQSEISVAANSTLTISGDATFGGGYHESISGEGSIVIEGTANHTSSQPLVISIASFLAGTFAGAAGTTTFSGGSVTITSMTTGSGATTFSGGASTVDSLTFSSSGASLTYTGTGTHTVTAMQSHVSGAATLDYSGLTGSLTIGKLDFGDSGTLTVNGNAYGTITEVSFTSNGATLAVSGTVNVGTVNITTSNDMGNITIADGATLNVTGAINVYPGNFASGAYSTITGASADTSTVVAGSINIGSGTTGAGLEVKNTTLITGGITFSQETNAGMFYLYLDNVTLGFTDSVTIAAAGRTGYSYIELGDKGSTTETTDTPSTTVINTNQYNTTTGAFTETGLSIEIQESIAGTGTLQVTGNGSLTLSAANTFSGDTKVTSGTLVANNASALGTGDVSVEGGQLSVNSGIEISNTISITLTEAYFDIYALTGEGSITLTDDALITITVSEAIKETLAAGGTCTFDVFDSLSLSSESFDTTALTSAGYELSWDQGVLTIVSTAPEPSMFGLFLGLDAIGLVATRRRKRA